MSAVAKRMIPLMNRVLVQKAEAATQSKGGVLIPENTRSQVTRGTVIAVGPGTKDSQGNPVPCCLKVGDSVLLPDYGGTKVKTGEKEEYFLYRDVDILATLNEKE